MGLLSKGVTLASALVGLALFSQSPEISQQYRQRLGGALEELRTVVSDFDADALTSEKSRDEALRAMQNSDDTLMRDRGTSMGRTITRFVGLDRQKFQMELAHPITRPLFVLQNPDLKILQGVWQDFEPAVPLTAAGGIYGGIGALIFAFLARLGIAPLRRRRQRKSDAALEDAIEVHVKDLPVNPVSGDPVSEEPIESVVEPVQAVEPEIAELKDETLEVENEQQQKVSRLIGSSARGSEQ